MTRAQIDLLWSLALRKSVKDGEQFTRYHFAAMIAEAEREGMVINSIHSCHSECQRPVCVLVREAVATERNACASMVEPLDESLADAIRARGQK